LVISRYLLGIKGKHLNNFHYAIVKVSSVI